MLKQENLVDELLDIIYNIEDFTTSDLQGVLSAWVKTNCKID
jgi:hypothetical protein